MSEMPPRMAQAEQSDSSPEGGDARDSQLSLFDRCVDSGLSVGRVNRSARQENEEERTIPAISGRKYFALLKNADPVSACLKTLLGTSRWDSTRCYLTWKVKATPQGRLLFQLVPQVRRIDATEFGLLPTPQAFDSNDLNRSPEALARAKEKGGCSNLRGIVRLLPTPTANKTTPQTVNPADIVNADGSEWTLGNKPYDKRTGKQIQTNLADAARLLPTQTSRDHKDGHYTPNVPTNGLLGREVWMLATPQSRDYRTGQAERWDNPARSRNLNDQVATEKSGKLSVTFVEWMMGFPNGWLDLPEIE